MKFLHSCLLLSVHLNFVLPLLTYYMTERCSENLLEMVDRPVSAGRLRLTYENERYRKDMVCTMSIRAPADHQLMVSFLDMEIEGFMSEGCESDYLMLYDGPDDKSPSMDNHKYVEQYTQTPQTNKLCGSLTPRATFVTTGDVVTLVFYSDMTIEYRGFDLIFTAFHTGKCETTEFRCNNKRCINASLHCDDYNNCGDDSDWCGPSNILMYFVIFICVAVFILLVTSVIRCACQEKARKFPKSSSSGADNDLITTSTGMRVSSFRGFSGRGSSISLNLSSEPLAQQEPLLNESQSSV
ncbi:uncharacterized protein LOC124142553 [Haliotis rufescens]|uniref:uncharacterized protein LOC124142553 n=1 Tax=Haliotis rufescens TaxID=6454 RepID=UPI00201ED657|nr:uncharacterized protein LOC124142553 [Haliotis rufescens]XP_046367065.2 uncharacterized protein LOC124142553 [Haliotis rufescens]